MIRLACAGVVVAALAGCMGGGGDVERPAEPVPCPRSGEFDARELLGLEEDRAAELASRRGCRLRVVVRDGESLAVTQDLRADRINVRVSRGVVVALDGVY